MIELPDISGTNIQYLEHTIEEIKRLRYWFSGFEAAGGKLPMCEGNMSALRKAQILLEEYATLTKNQVDKPSK